MNDRRVVRKIAGSIQEERLKAAAYCRVSTGKIEQEESLETQEIVYRKIIEAHPGWELAGVYVDSGRSGTCVKKRPAFQKMLEDAKAGKIDLILVKSISRFARNVVDSQRCIRMLKEYDISVHFEKERINTQDPSSEFIFSLLAAIAQDESCSISENVKWSYHKNFARGYYNLGNHRILGYDCVEGKLTPNRDAWIVREIFQRFLAGQTYRQIADGITAMGARCLRSKKGFSPETIRCMIANETYVGDKLLQKKAPVDFITKAPDPDSSYSSNYLYNDHEGIIDRITWEKTQIILRQRRMEVAAGVQKKGKKHHVLYGKVFCGECGAPYTRRTFRGGVHNGTVITYKAWNCRERQKGRAGSGCKNRIIKEPLLLQEISRIVGWEWKGAEEFDAELFERSVSRVELFKEKMIVRPMNTRRQNGSEYWQRI